MHRLVSSIVIVGLALAPSIVSAQAGDGLKGQTFQLKKKAPAVGDVETVALGLEMRLDFVLSGPDMDSEPLELSNTSSSNYSMTVLAARKGLLERVKVVYGDMYEDAVEEGKKERTVSPVNGKTYVAGLEKGRMVVTTEDGKPVSPEELAAIKENLPELGKVDALEAALPDKPLRVGDSLDRFAKVLTKEVLQPDDPAARFTGTRVRLSEIVQDARGAVGIFSVSTTMTVQEKDSPVTVTIPLEGKMSLLAEGARMFGFSLAGPASVGLSKELRAAGISVAGEGGMKLTVTDPTWK
ncbi:hypothetical protein [Pyxidicoccus trucidator]|uniref:hypothetical protein n=1 Tax=Pyxidicoccus trucidator TaxID=2709662 RepID=UPI0013DAF039|nr:hypothetical protein [Pyxidicoccus trucidator]